MNFTTNIIVKTLSINPELVLEFFIFFSRFEYSLKRSGFLKTREKAVPDWDNYANSIKEKFDGVANRAFQEAVEFLISDPPDTQIVTEKMLGWRKTVQGSGEHDARYILRLVATVRNNLFHGGKFPIPVGPVEDVARNERLLQACITVLNQCLALCVSVQSSFQETA